MDPVDRHKYATGITANWQGSLLQRNPKKHQARGCVAIPLQWIYFGDRTRITERLWIRASEEHELLDYNEIIVQPLVSLLNRQR